MIYNLLSLNNLGAGILSTIGYYALALLVLLFMITVHEFGHYIVAKIFNFKINEFAIGMGPAIFKKQKKNGEFFSLRILPLGGFCAFEGEDDDASDPNAFNNKKPWQRILVLIAGASMNFIAAIIVFCISITGYGQMCMQAFEVIEQPSSAYSLQNEDIILSLNGKSIYLTTDLIGAINGKKKNDVVEATVLRDGVKTDISVRLVEDATSSSMQDISGILKSLGIATLSGVTNTENKEPDKFINGDVVLRIDDHAPTFFDAPGEGLTECNIVENGVMVTKYVDEQTYLSVKRAYTPDDFVNMLREFEENSTVYFYISRANANNSSDRILLKYDLEGFTDHVKQSPAGIYGFFDAEIVHAGYRMYSENVNFDFFEGLGRGVVYAFKNVGSTLSAFWQLITGKLGIDALGGPITTVSMTSQYAALGFNYLLEIAGFIGVSLAVFNLLPIPALDGARVVFIIIEWIRKKPVPRNVEGMIHAVGLIALLIFAIGIDLVKCF